jgi:glycosyltransferase involved in cell wall biosynthesis
MPVFSPVVTTRGRSAPLERFLESLRAQRFQGLEIILVDQTSGPGLDGLIEQFQNDLLIRRIRIAPCGISAARNEGLKHARGDIIAFPDDDCAYPPGLLAQIFQGLENGKTLDGISCFVCDEKGAGSAGGVMARDAGDVSFSNVWKTAVSCSFFMRRETVEAVGSFDEQLGVGSAGGCWSGEETDWLLRALAAGKRIVYRPDLRVFHPQPGFENLRKAFRYGRGAGRVFRKHRYPVWFIAASAGFQLVRAAGELLRLRPRAAGARLAMAAGRISG